MTLTRRLLVFVLFTCTCACAEEPRKSLVGVNTDFLVYYSPACPTIDAIKSAHPFGSIRNPTDRRCALDENGWPKEDFGVLVATDVPGLNGVYKFSCEGKANVAGMWGRTIVTNQKCDGKITTADVDFKGGKAFALTCTGTNGGVRNVKLLRPGYTSDAGCFTSAYIKSKEPFGGVRLMNWLQTNDSKTVHWDDRCKATDAQWTRKGGPWEPWLDYAAKYHKDLWLNIPHQADEDYIHQLAKLCKERLGDANVNLYLEDTNEYWNWQFPQAKWIDKLAQERAVDWKLNDPPTHPGNFRHRYHARRTIEIAKAFREAFGEANASRIRPILTGQLANSTATADAMKWIETQYGPAKNFVYGVACAPYFGTGGNISERLDLTPQDLADHLLTTAKRYSTPESKTAAGVRKFHEIARKAGVHSIAYEGGVDLGQPSHKFKGKELEVYVNARISSQKLPTTGEALSEYFNWWFNSGGQEFFYFTDFSMYSRSGVWGLTNHPTNLDTPKYKAAAAAANAHPAP